MDLPLASGWVVNTSVDSTGILTIYVSNENSEVVSQIKAREVWQGDGNGEDLALRFTARAQKEPRTEKCPECGKKLIERKGTSVFLGCSGFPKCRYTRSLNTATFGKRNRIRRIKA
jgi:hypothetical protein